MSASISPAAASTAATLRTIARLSTIPASSPHASSAKSSDRCRIPHASGSTRQPPPSIATPSTAPWMSSPANSAATSPASPTPGNFPCALRATGKPRSSMPQPSVRAKLLCAPPSPSAPPLETHSPCSQTWPASVSAELRATAASGYRGFTKKTLCAPWIFSSHMTSSKALSTSPPPTPNAIASYGNPARSLGHAQRSPRARPAA